MSATATGEALACVHRLLSESHIFGLGDVSSIIESVVHCDFLQTETGDDEIAIMWAFEVFEACLSLGHHLDDSLLESIFVVLYKNCTCSTNADMLRRFAARKLGTFVLLHFKDFYSKDGGPKRDEFVLRVFKFLCHGIDPDIPREMEARQICLDLVINTLLACVDGDNFLVLEHQEMKELITNNLFRAILQTSQAAGRNRAPASSETHEIVNIQTDNVEESVPLENRGLLTFEALDEMAHRESHHLSTPSVRVSLSVLSRSLRIFQILVSFSESRRILKIQIHCFFQSVFLRVLEPPSKNSDLEARRLVLETLTDLFADPSLSIDIFANYDCNLHFSNIYEQLFVYLSNYSFPKTKRVALDSLQLMALRCIHLGIASISNRIGVTSSEQQASLELKVASPSELMARKLQKNQLMKCADEFNHKAKRGIQALVDAGVIDSGTNAAQIAGFLRSSPNVEKVAIGEYIGSNGDMNISVLGEFVNTFDMEKQTLLGALRMFLESFRLPGEAQMIDRILQKFAEHAHRSCVDAKLFPTVDCTYLLCFSIILLNTDLHNPNIRPEKKMTFEAFKRQNINYGAEVSQGKDMPIEVLHGIFDEIKQREINTMSEGSALTAEVTTERWRDLLRDTEEMVVIKNCHDAISFKDLYRVYDRHMFATIQKPAFVALSVVYHGGDLEKQPKAVDLALEAMLACAKVASSYEMVSVLDAITIDLCKFTTLLKYRHVSQATKEEDIEDSVSVVLEEDDESQSNKTPKPSSASVVSTGSATTTAHQESAGYQNSVAIAQKDIAKHPKAQQAIQTIFEIAKRYGNSLRRAWSTVMYCLLRLFDLDLLPWSLLVESSDICIDLESRLQFHRNLASPWMKEVSTSLKRAQDSLERSTGWVSWFNSDTKHEAEENLRFLEDEHFVVSKAVKFASNSLGGERKEDTNVHAKELGIRVSNLLAESLTLSDDILVSCVHGLIAACGGAEDKELFVGMNEYGQDENADSRGDIHIDMLTPSSSASRLFGLHYLTELALINVHRIGSMWEMIKSHFFLLLKGSTGCFTEKSFLGLLRICTRIAFSPTLSALHEDVMVCVKILMKLESVPGCERMVLRAYTRTLETVAREKTPGLGVWNEFVGKSLIAMSAASPEVFSSDGLQLLRVLVSHPEVDEIPVAQAVAVLNAYKLRAIAIIRDPSSPDDLNDSLVDILNLLFILLSKLLSSRPQDMSLQVCQTIYAEILDVALDAQNSLQVRVHATNILTEAMYSTVEHLQFSAGEWIDLASVSKKFKSVADSELYTLFSKSLVNLITKYLAENTISESEFVVTKMLSMLLESDQKHLAESLATVFHQNKDLHPFVNGDFKLLVVESPRGPTVKTEVAASEPEETVKTQVDEENISNHDEDLR